MAPMNRHKGIGLDRVAAVREAGNAVARYLSADLMGFRADEAIDYIDIAPPFSRPSLDAKTILAPKAETIGPVYSRPMMDFLKTDAISGTPCDSKTAPLPPVGYGSYMTADISK